MQEIIRERLLDSRGDSYVQSRLKGGLELAKALYRSWYPEYRARAVVPSYCSDSRMYRFAEGGLLEEGPLVMHTGDSVLQSVSDTSGYLARAVFGCLQLSPSRALICESMNDDPPGLRLRRAGISVMSSSAHVYPFIRGPVSEGDVLNAIRRAFAIPHSLYVVCEGEVVSRLNSRADTVLEKPDFEALARAFQWGAVGAYDGESFVVWSS